MSTIDELISDYFLGLATPDDTAALRAYIHADPANARKFMRAAMMHNALHDLLKEAVPPLEDASPHLQNVPPAARPARSARLLPWLHTPRSFTGRMLTAAGLIAVLALLSLYLNWSRTPVATLTRTAGAQWEYPSDGFSSGQPLTRRTFGLYTGFAAIHFNSGASVLVEGPAEFKLLSPSRIRLLSGRLTTLVPPAAVGFTVDIPSASVVDLGTEVGIDVKPGRETHVEVFKGKAGIKLDSAAPSAPMNRILTQSMAISLDPYSGKIADALPEPLAFTRVNAPTPSLAESRAESSLARWQAFSTAIRHDPDLLAYYTFDPSSTSPRLLRNESLATAGHSDGIIESAQPAPGRFPGKPALRFNGSTSRIHIDIPQSTDALTIAAWVKLDRFEREFASLLMSDSPMRDTMCHFQFYNRKGKPSVDVGIPERRQFWSNYTFPSTDLAESLNQWHLVVIVYEARARKLCCWIDGKYIDGKRLVAVRPLTIGPAEIGNRDAATDRALDGLMDELAVWKRPLSSREIVAMYEAGMPASSDKR